MRRTLTLAAAGFALGIALTAHARPPDSLQLQGFLTDQNEVPINGEVEIVYSVVDEDGTELFNAMQTETVEGGLIDTIMRNVDASVFETDARAGTDGTAGAQRTERGHGSRVSDGHRPVMVRSVSMDQWVALFSPPAPASDPLDRMLVCQARVEGLVVITPETVSLSVFSVSPWLIRTN